MRPEDVRHAEGYRPAREERRVTCAWGRCAQAPRVGRAPLAGSICDTEDISVSGGDSDHPLYKSVPNTEHRYTHIDTHTCIQTHIHFVCVLFQESVGFGEILPNVLI